MTIYESHPTAPSGFLSQAPPPANELLARFSLGPNNLAGLETKLAALATPGGSEFRQRLSKDKHEPLNVRFLETAGPDRDDDDADGEDDDELEYIGPPLQVQRHFMRMTMPWMYWYVNQSAFNRLSQEFPPLPPLPASYASHDDPDEHTANMLEIMKRQLDRKISI
ncbi:hypothetical protein B0H19DRAFT_1276702 [Mycena capillaripes]|nr:hypothetical protein B0H19DRAFT_1276702 [Mycena capillaripes]